MNLNTRQNDASNQPIGEKQTTACDLVSKKEWNSELSTNHLLAKGSMEAWEVKTVRTAKLSVSGSATFANNRVNESYQNICKMQDPDATDSNMGKWVL